MRRVLALTAASLVLLAGTASAHVSVTSPGATQDGFATLTFRVPTEKDVPTTKVQIAFPADAPLALVSVKPHPGWTYQVVKATLTTPVTVHDTEISEAVSSITWTATAGGIKAGEFDEFEVSAGPLPEKAQLVFKALQTYSDGETVRWIESGEDAEHPAPTLATAGLGTTAHSSATPTVKAVPVATKAKGADEGDNALGAVGVGLGILALLIALASLAVGRRA